MKGMHDMNAATITPAEINAVNAALARAARLGVHVKVDAYEVADILAEMSRDDDVDIERVEIGRLNGRPWYVGLTNDHTEPGSPRVAYLERGQSVPISRERAAWLVARGVHVRYVGGSWHAIDHRGYAETFPVADD